MQNTPSMKNSVELVTNTDTVEMTVIMTVSSLLPVTESNKKIVIIYAEKLIVYNSLSSYYVWEEGFNKGHVGTMDVCA